MGISAEMKTVSISGFFLVDKPINKHIKWLQIVTSAVKESKNVCVCVVSFWGLVIREVL